MVLLASAITFDPCFSDCLATFVANATLGMAPRERLYGHSGDDDADDGSGSNTAYRGLTRILRELQITNALCTPTLWATVEGNPPENVPTLQVVALGGEPIPKTMVGRWARRKPDVIVTDEGSGEWHREYPRLYATYGVTEACVYQTCGEVVQSQNTDCKNQLGQSVGVPLLGTIVSICCPLPEEELPESIPQLERVQQSEDGEPAIGEVVLSGAQVDAMSSYLNLPELTKRVFVQSCDEKVGNYPYFYRTGDLGYLDPSNNNALRILGRIKGDGMVKLNGIRIELAEIESSVIDDVADGRGGALVAECIASVTTASPTAASDDNEGQHKQLIAYCILSPASISELSIRSEQLRRGLIIPPGPLLSLLRARCDRRVRKGCTPAFFVLIDRLPLGPTGKKDRSQLPLLSKCSLMGDKSNEDGCSLWDCGVVGPIVSRKICECLNLQSCQRHLITRDTNFFTLGGDSLAATRITRGLYALHHGVRDSRNLGGATGTLDGCFAAKYLIQSSTLGAYVDFLHSHSAFEMSTATDDTADNAHMVHNATITSDVKHSADPLFSSLIEAITLGYSSVALGLLDLGVDPNSQPSRGRLGKVKDRNQQRILFQGNPLHLACIRGDHMLVERLLSKGETDRLVKSTSNLAAQITLRLPSLGCKANTPNATGSFPIHLACSSLEDTNAAGEEDASKEDVSRKECVRMLLEAGTPITIKDGNKQTILHSAARSGRCELLRFVMSKWKNAVETMGIKSQSNDPDEVYDW